MGGGNEIPSFTAPTASNNGLAIQTTTRAGKGMKLGKKTHIIE
jgi:hypothetical protein